MPWKNHLLYFAVTATLTSFKLCGGRAGDDAEAAVLRPTVQASLHFSGVGSGGNHESASTTRQGSLAFNFDQQGDPNSTHVLHNVMDAKLKRMDPSVECSNNVMTLKVRRAGALNFLVDHGAGPPTPLSQMPTNCGFSVKRSRRDVQYAASYQGCHVTQQGGDYVLPLRLWGAPVTMSCPAILPSPSVFCFSSAMVVKINGITADELKVNVSSKWETLPSACNSCGLIAKEFSGGITLTAPYNKGLCIEIKDEEYLLSLLWKDVELLATCPPILNVKPTFATVMPPIDTGQAPQPPQYSQFPLFAQYPVPIPTYAPAPAISTVAPLPRPQLSLHAAADFNTENQEVPAAQHPAFPFVPQFPQYLLIPGPEPPTQSYANKNTAAPPVQLPQMPLSPQYPFHLFPQYPIVPGVFHPTTPTPPPVTSAEALVTTPAPITEHRKPQDPQLPQFPVPPQYPFLSFRKRPVSPKDQTQALEDPKPVIQQPKPQHVYPQTYQIPVLYPSAKYPSKRQNTQSQTAAPATTSTTTVVTTQKPAALKPFYHPHPYMPLYYAPQQAAMPVFPDPPTTPLSNPAPSDRHEERPAFHAMSPLYPLPSHQRSKSVASDW